MNREVVLSFVVDTMQRYGDLMSQPQLSLQLVKPHETLALRHETIPSNVPFEHTRKEPSR